MSKVSDQDQAAALREAERAGQKKLRDYLRSEIGIQTRVASRTGIVASGLSQMSWGKRPVTVEAAMLLEIDSDGALLAAELCPAKAELFAKFKARG